MMAFSKLLVVTATVILAATISVSAQDYDFATCENAYALASSTFDQTLTGCEAARASCASKQCGNCVDYGIPQASCSDGCKYCNYNGDLCVEFGTL